MAKKPAKILKKKSSDKKDHLFIVGIGASAGGLEALKFFFDKIPADNGMAFIIVQHLDPTHKSILSELIATHTKMKVVEITNGLKVKHNCVYTIPPNKDLTISESTLHLTKPKELRNVRKTIDTFFNSLAEDQKEKAIGVILSGTGSDGTLGLKEIKAEGGVTFVQEPKTAQFDGMPKSAINAKVADYILAPEKISGELLRYTKNRKNTILKPEKENVTFEDQLKKIFQIILNQSGYDFSNYKINTIERRISKRISLNQINSIDEYLHFLQHHPAEVEKLYKDFLIGVTSFFRDKEIFASIEKKVIPLLVQKCKNKQELRIWVCACSTGEEAFSLAILLKEAIEKYKCHFKVMIFASDIDTDAIEFARSATYSEEALTNVSPERLSKFFVPKQNAYQIKKEIREMVVFAHHNLIKDPPFSKMDLITCRNLLIYLKSDLQKRIIPLFNYSLNTDGILLLGASESIGDTDHLFTAIDAKSKIYKKKKQEDNRKPKGEYVLPYVDNNSSQPIAKSAVIEIKKINFPSLTEKILLDQYAPPSVIIDKDNIVLYFSGETGQYLEPKGIASLDILEMAKKNLKPSLEATIKKARSHKREEQTKGIDVKVNHHYQTINIIVKPVLSKEPNLGALMIIFEISKSEKIIPEKNSRNAEKIRPEITALEKELKLTREHLQTAIDELETSNEDLQTANEEYQSTNEELQSSNEELETSREELQSVNEELTTVNSELSDKLEQLSQSNDDLNNLLSSIDVATIFLDRNLKVKRFTPTATKIFNLIPSDIDRPVTHLSSNIIYKELTDDVKHVLKTLSVRSADVHAIDGTSYHMRIMPYRTTENVIEGVLITFIEITEQKKVEEKLKKTNEHLNLIMENLPAIPFTCLVAKSNIKISFVGKSCKKVTGFTPEQFTDKTSFWIHRVHPEDKKKILSAFSNIAKKGSFDLPFKWKCANGEYKQFINYIRYAKPENERPAYIVGVWKEVANNTKTN